MSHYLSPVVPTPHHTAHSFPNGLRFREGQVIKLRPSRPAFAQSSGSWRGPAPYERPCVVTRSDQHRLYIAPILGARQNHHTRRWGPKPRMVHDWWNPVNMINFAGPPEDRCRLRRPPIDISINRQNAQFLPFTLKPSYVWVGDSGEPFNHTDVNANTVQSVEYVYGPRPNALPMMRAQQEIWQQRRRPPY